jgi:hypothetical protein
MWFYKDYDIIDESVERTLMERLVAEARRRFGKPMKMLLLPPDLTRYHSGAGRLSM